ncbi:hypothetical protein [Acidihalobacter aeolianus]|uniref:hypothetical protein n=1 Tax=Acidihalobacter aeolianus TaxID=2792603 RepID=UPI0012EA8220|nr:hypothetical protein [Acidihalobacter aeolianus]
MSANALHGILYESYRKYGVSVWSIYAEVQVEHSDGDCISDVSSDLAAAVLAACYPGVAAALDMAAT